MNRYATTPLPTAASAAPANSATQPQIDFITALLAQRVVPEPTRLAIQARLDAIANGEHEFGMTKRVASDVIGKLKELPKRQQELPVRSGAPRDIVAENRQLITPSDVRAGHYAIKNGEGELRFYNVWWAPEQPGRSPFFKLYVEHGPDDSELPFRPALAILREISKDPATAARLYGRHIRHCSECHRRLTNRISRLLDIGPVCGGHFYDEEIWKSMKARARQALRDAGLDPNADVEDTDDLDSIRDRAGL